MKQTGQFIQEAEAKWLEPIFGFIKAEFEKTPLPSHDHFHHLRVWQNARFLLQQFPSRGIQADYRFVESLLIASLFHDAGMMKTQEKDHGKESKEICADYFLEKEKPEDLIAILEAVERHDDKTYSGFGPLFSKSVPNLITALNICDDLDAFGNIGVYRYSEIYLMRGIPMEDLGLKIIANLSGRFRHFMSGCTGLEKMIVRHIPRYKIIEDFFRYYNLVIRKVEQGEKDMNSGPLAVVKQIYRHNLMNIPTMEEVCEKVLADSDEGFVRNYFTALHEELKQGQDI